MPGESYEHLVILDGKMEIQKVYEGTYDFLGENDILTITFQNNTIIHEDTQKSAEPPRFVILMKTGTEIIGYYKVKTLEISQDKNVFIFKYDTVGSIEDFSTDVDKINDYICDSNTNVVNLLSPRNNNYGVCNKSKMVEDNTIILIKNFNKLINSIIYNTIVVKLISPKEEDVFKGIKFQYETYRVNLNISSIVKSITSVEYIPTIFVQIKDMFNKLEQENKITKEMQKMKEPKDVRDLTYLLNTFRTYLKKEKANNTTEVVTFRHTIASYVHVIIQRKLNTLKQLYKLKGTSDGNIYYSVNSFIDIINIPENYKKIDNEYIKYSNTRLITYIKINNTESSSVIESLRAAGKNNYRYNERFNILVDKKTYSSMIVQYNSHNIKYYNDDTEQDKLSNFTTEIMADKTHYSDSDSDNKIINYDYTYRYGHFSKIFTPNKTNQDISLEMKEVISMLSSESPKPVFIIGYGSSGAGKTSSLIYFNKGNGDQKDGVLIWLLKNLCGMGRYNKVEFYIKEFSNRDGNTILRTPENDNIKYDYDSDNNTFNINTDNFDQFNQIKEYITGNKKRNKYRTTGRSINPKMAVEKDGAQTEVPKLDYDNDTIDSYTDIGDILIRLIDTNRFVKATTNNPNSSRSHVVVYVKLLSDKGKPGYLYIGDFAGVENKFGCDDVGNIQRFLDIPRDAEKNNNGAPMKTPTRYYNAEPTEMKEDKEYMFGGYLDATLGLNEQYLNAKIAEIDGSSTVEKAFDYDNIPKNILSVKKIYDLYFKGTTPGSKLKLLDIISKHPPIEIYQKLEEDLLEQKRFKLKRSIDPNSKYKYDAFFSLPNEIHNSLTEFIVNNDILSNIGTKQKGFDERKKNLLTTLFEVDDNIKMVISFDTTQPGIEKPIDITTTAANDNLKTVINNFLSIEFTGKCTMIKDTSPVNTKIFSCNILVEKNNLPVYINTIQKELENQIKNNKEGKNITSFNTYLTPASKSVGKADFVVDNINFNIDKKQKFKEWVGVKELVQTTVKFELGENYTIKYLLDYRAVGTTGSFLYIKELTIVIPNKNIEKLKKEGLATSLTLNEILLEYTPQTQPDTTIAKKEFNDNKKYIEDNVLILINLHTKITDIFKNDKYNTDEYSKSINDINDNLKKLKPITKQITENKNDLKIILESVKKVKELYDHFFSGIDTLSPKFKELVESIKYKYNQGVLACKNREKEGDYINSSLADIRKTIEEMMTVKNGDRFIAPAFMYDCYKSYCPSEIDCFMPKKTSITNTIPSNIFESIRADTGLDKNKFYTDLLLCVFCVFNIARSANNPPISRYIDINELKYFVATKGKTFLDATTGGGGGEKDKPSDNPSNKPSNKPSDKLKSRQKLGKQDNIPSLPLGTPRDKTNQPVATPRVVLKQSEPTQRVEAQTAPVKAPAPIDVLRNFNSIIARIAKNIGYPGGNVIYNRDIHDKDGLLLYNVSGSEPMYILQDMDKFLENKRQNITDTNRIYFIIEYINQSKIIERFDNFNAASTIGTLDFADRFAKMNMVENTCTKYNIENKDRKKIDSEGDYKQLDQKEYHQLLRE
jgi:hypothetical protein